MMQSSYKLRYIQLFSKDLEEIVEYISTKLNNPMVANNLIDRIEKAIFERLGNAEAFEIYKSAKERRYQYYRIYVGNFVIYYVVIDDEDIEKIMEVRRILYNKHNHGDIL